MTGRCHKACTRMMRRIPRNDDGTAKEGLHKNLRVLILKGATVNSNLTCGKPVFGFCLLLVLCASGVLLNSLGHTVFEFILSPIWGLGRVASFFGYLYKRTPVATIPSLNNPKLWWPVNTLGPTP